MRLSVLPLCICILYSIPAWPADVRPKTVPTYDVDITYSISRDGETLRERTRWRVATQQQRIDPPGAGPYMIMDEQTRHIALIDDTKRSIIDMQAPPAGPLDLGSTAAFKHLGQDTVAGLTCDLWQTTAMGTDAVLCFTADGALLRVQAAGRTLVEAKSVSYAPTDPSLFQVPTGYQHMTATVPSGSH